MPNIDYSKSAVNLTNPIDAQKCLKDLSSFKSALVEVLSDISLAIPIELLAKKATLENDIDTVCEVLRTIMDEQGSYQDVEAGMYAVKQRKVSISYDPQVFRAQYPDYAPAVIKETVDTTKLNGLIKGGLLTPEDLEKQGVSSKSESFAYIIKTG